MNKYQEARKIFERIIDNEAYNERFQNTCKLVIELIEKATPKKPIYGDFEEVDDNVYVPNTAKCPTCGNDFKFGEFNDMVNHHCECGQKLDWK